LSPEKRVKIINKIKKEISKFNKQDRKVAINKLKKKVREISKKPAVKRVVNKTNKRTN